MERKISVFLNPRKQISISFYCLIPIYRISAFDSVAMQAPLTRLNIARYYYSLFTINGKHGLQLLVVVL